MNRVHTVDQRFCQALMAGISVLAIVVAGPLDSVGQDERTASVRGIVVDEAGMPVANSRVAVHIPGGRRTEADAPTGEFTVKMPSIGNEMMMTAQNQSGELQGVQLFRI